MEAMFTPSKHSVDRMCNQYRLLSTRGADKVAGGLVLSVPQQKCKCGVCKPKLPASKKVWAALHKEARRRAAAYYHMKAIEEQLASFNLCQTRGRLGTSPGCHVKLETQAAPFISRLLKPAVLCKPPQWRR